MLGLEKQTTYNVRLTLRRTGRVRSSGRVPVW